MASKAERAAREVLAQNRAAADRYAQEAGRPELRKLLQVAQRDLEQRLKKAVSLQGPGSDSYTATQLRATLAQVKEALKPLQRGLRDIVVDKSRKATEDGAEGAARYLAAADRAYRGVGVQPLALDVARMFSAAGDGSEASILGRLAGGKDPGVLQRYGVAVIGSFEAQLRKGVVAKSSLAEVRDALAEESPFLQGAPSHWADRIVRTELSGAHNRAAFEAIKEADAQLGDMVKIMSCVFDERTGSDSYSCHGQIRRLEEPFETWYGPCMHPPDRPNDRGVLTSHRLVWPIPPYLAWRDDAEVAKAWAREHGPKSKAKMPPRPVMTTVPLSDFARAPKGAPEEEDG